MTSTVCSSCGVELPCLDHGPLGDFLSREAGHHGPIVDRLITEVRNLLAKNALLKTGLLALTKEDD